MNRKPARWLLPDLPAEGVAALARDAGLSAPAARVLWKRGYRTAQQAHQFLHPDLAGLHSPFLLAGMEQATRRLGAAIAANEKILLYGDYDVDGTSAVVILHTVLRLAGAQVDYYVPHRIKDGYGMRTDAVDQAAGKGVRLIVSVDTGIRAAAVVEHARALSIDVIITDHHLPEAALPDAVAVINPNRPDCTYPEKNLCGAAVAWKLADGLLTTLGWAESRRAKLLPSLMKLAAIATVADVVPLTGENRILVHHGLEGLRQNTNPGLRALLEVAGIRAGEAPTSHQVGFQIGPRINAAGRMDDASEVIRMFVDSDADQAMTIARRLDDLNKERQTEEKAIRDRILAECASREISDSEAGLIFAGEGWHQGVIGIVAGRLAERYSRPVFVLSIDRDTGHAHGSGRSQGSFHLLEAMESMPELFQRFGGHRQAAGLKMDAAAIPEFQARFAAQAAARIPPEELCPLIEFDAAVSLDELTDRAATELLSLAPFGNANPAPVLALLDAKLDGEPRVVKEQHLFLNLRHGDRSVQAKAWNRADAADGVKPGDSVHAAVVLEPDEWSRSRGRGFWSLQLKDLRTAKPVVR